jgi:hypothetical protein
MSTDFLSNSVPNKQEPATTSKASQLQLGSECKYIENCTNITPIMKICIHFQKSVEKKTKLN